MYDELVFSVDEPSEKDAYTGGGAYLPTDLPWPRGADEMALVHLMSIPGEWFSPALAGGNYWISVFIPFIAGEVAHFRRLRANSGASDAVVMGYSRGTRERNEACGEIIGRGKISLLRNTDPDDDENLASKLDGVDAWLQSPVVVQGMRRRLSIYGGDLDVAMPKYKGILSDGMGYLFIGDSALDSKRHGVGRFFLQIG